MGLGVGGVEGLPAATTVGEALGDGDRRVDGVWGGVRLVSGEGEVEVEKVEEGEGLGEGDAVLPPPPPPPTTS